MTDYKNIIRASVSKKGETVREAVSRIENSAMFRSAQPMDPRLQQKPQNQEPAPTIEFTLDKEKNQMSVTKSGKTILELEGDEMWGEAMTYFKKLKYRGELPQDTKFVMNTEKRGPIDISWEFKQKAA